ncbi:hypothetical protein Tco_0231791 [Tanacetum coccineum]
MLSRGEKKDNLYHDEVQDLTREDDDLKICLHIAPDEDKVIDAESLDHQYPIIEWQSFFLTTKPQYDPTKPNEDIYLNKVTRSNGHQRFFRTLMGVLSILDREDLKVIYELVMEEYKDTLPEGFDKMLWGDLMIMFNQENRYPLAKEVLSNMLELKLETEEESSMALELIKFVKQQLEEFEDSNDDDTVTSAHEEEEREGHPICSQAKGLKVEERLVQLRMGVRFEVLIEKKKMYYLGLRRFDLWMEFLMVHLEELGLRK